MCNGQLSKTFILAHLCEKKKAILVTFMQTIPNKDCHIEIQSLLLFNSLLIFSQ